MLHFILLVLILYYDFDVILSGYSLWQKYVIIITLNNRMFSALGLPSEQTMAKGQQPRICNKVYSATYCMEFCFACICRG